MFVPMKMTVSTLLLAAHLQLSALGAANQSLSTVCDCYKVFLLEFSV